MSHDPTLHAERCQIVAARMREEGGGVLLVPAADERMRNNDSEYPFRQDSDFVYLVGLDEPQACALFFAGGPSDSSKGRLVLFVRPRDPEKEVWTGRRLGVEGAKEEYGAAEAYPVSEMDKKLPELLDGAGALWFRFGHDPLWDGRVARALNDLRARSRAGARAPQRFFDSGLVLHELRLFKTEPEIQAMRRAAEITAEAHVAAMAAGRAGRREYEVQAEIDYVFRNRGGAGPSYGTIVATGANSTVLHHRAGNAELLDGQVCLVDAGAEYEFYAADVSRTFPVSGKFTDRQRALYEVVLEAQLAGIAAVKPGVTVDEVHDLVVRKLTHGMVRLGLLQGSVDDRIADKSYRKYYMHRTSHWLGMDAHDVGAYNDAAGRPRPLAPGMVLTMEPGLYVPQDDTNAPGELRGVGIRIEDDLLVTADGNENLTAAVPKTVAEVEAACAR